jgi:hypothetical protein
MRNSIQHGAGEHETECNPVPDAIGAVNSWRAPHAADRGLVSGRH